MKNFKISIIVPVFNAEKYLRETVESVITQNYKNWELIAINDGSFDKSLEILTEFSNLDSRIKVITIGNKGVSNARNIGLSNASGDYILMLDSDDALAPNMLSILNNICIQNKPDIVSFNFKKILNTIPNEVSISKNTSAQNIDSWEFFNKAFNKFCKKKYLGGYIWLRLFKRDILDNIFFDLKLRFYEDEDFLAKLLAKKSHSLRIVHTDEKLYMYRKHEFNTMNQNRIRRLFALFTLQKKMASYFPVSSKEFTLFQSLRIRTLILLEQFFLSKEHPVCFKIFFKIIISNINKVPLKSIIPYIFGKKIAILYSKYRLNSNHFH